MSSVNGMGLSLDDAYGDDNVVHKWFPVTDFKVTMNNSLKPTPNIGSLGQKHTQMGLFEVTGSFNMLCRPEYMPYLLYSLLGGLSTGAVADSLYTHVCTPAGAPKSLTLAITRDDNAANLQETYPGAVITEMKFSFKPGEPIMVAVTFFAKTMNLDARGAPSFSTDPPLIMLTSDDYLKYGGAADSYISAAEVTIKREYPGLDAESVLGSRFRKSATSGLITMEGTMDRIFKEDSALNEFLGSATAVAPAEDPNTHALDIRSKSNTLVGATSVYQMNWVADEILFDTRDSGVDRQALEVENIKWFAQDDDTNDFISVNCKNGRATYTN